MNEAITPAKAPATDVAPSPEDDWLDDEPVGDHKERDALRSVLPILVGSVAVGIAVVAVVGVRLSRHRKSKSILAQAVTRAEDARDALMHAAAELPGRSRAAARRVWR